MREAWLVEEVEVRPDGEGDAGYADENGKGVPGRQLSRWTLVLRQPKQKRG